MRVAVTGATGFIGQAMCRALVAAEHEAVALVRAESDRLPGPVRQVGIGDLERGAGLAGALEGVDGVIHLAGRAHRLRDPAPDPDEAFRLANVEGTRRLLDAAAEAGVRRLVLASSVKAVGERTSVPWTEQTPPRPVDPYGRSKLEAERLVLARDRDRGLRTSVVRLPLVYGPGAGANVLRLVGLVRSGMPLPFGSIRNARSMLYLDNAVAAFLAVLGHDGAAGQAFFAADREALSTPDLVRVIAAALGRRPRLVPCPVWLLAALGRVGDLLRLVVPVPVGSADVERLTSSLVVDPSLLTAVTGFVPPVSAEAGWRETVRSLADHQS